MPFSQTFHAASSLAAYAYSIAGEPTRDQRDASSGLPPEEALVWSRHHPYEPDPETLAPRQLWTALIGMMMLRGCLVTSMFASILALYASLFSVLFSFSC